MFLLTFTLGLMLALALAPLGVIGAIGVSRFGLMLNSLNLETVVKHTRPGLADEPGPATSRWKQWVTIGRTLWAIRLRAPFLIELMATYALLLMSHRRSKLVAPHMTP